MQLCETDRMGLQRELNKMETQMESKQMETQMVRIQIGEIAKPIVIRLDPIVDASGVTTFTPHVITEEQSVAEITPAVEDTTASSVVESHHVGEIGDRVTLKLRMLRHKIVRSLTTIAYVYDFRDMEGNVYQWMTHRNKGLREGGDYYLKCTVKKFYKRRGVNITAITRCRLM